MTKKMAVEQFSELASAVVRSLPREMDADIAQGWITNQNVLARVLENLLTPPKDPEPFEQPSVNQREYSLHPWTGFGEATVHLIQLSNRDPYGGEKQLKVLHHEIGSADLLRAFAVCYPEAHKRYLCVAKDVGGDLVFLDGFDRLTPIDVLGIGRISELRYLAVPIKGS